MRIKHGLFLCSFLLCYDHAVCLAQRVRFTFDRADTLVQFAHPSVKSKFGGISGIDVLPHSGDHPLFLLASDHHPDAQASCFFFMDTSLCLRNGITPKGLDQVEAVRYDALTTRLWYSYEKDNATGIGYLRKENGYYQMCVVLDEPIPGAHTAPNRGIEAICFGPDRSLWAAFESGTSEEAQYQRLAFYKIPFNEQLRDYDTSRKLVFSYPFDRRSGLTPAQPFGASLGNGVTDILCLPDSSLLVLERCYNGVQALVRLYQAWPDEGSRTMRKQLVYDFRKDTGIPGFQPDNLEAMCFSESHGALYLYLLSDDNFSSRQCTQLVRLKCLRQ